MGYFAGSIASWGFVTSQKTHHFLCEDGFPYHMLGYLSKGKGILTVNGVTYPQSPSRAVLFAPHTSYEVNMCKNYQTMWVQFSAPPRWEPYLHWGFGAGAIEENPFCVLKTHTLRAQIAGLMKQTIAYLESELRARMRLAELALEQVLLLLHECTGSREQDKRLTTVIREMRQDPAAPWREEDLARMAGLSVSRFAHLFRKEMNMPPLRFLERVRMERAKIMLSSTDMRINEVARACGYEDALYFSARFRHVEGYAPSHFKKGGQ